MRTALLIVALGGFACLGLIDLSHGRTETGVAALLLVGANYLLLV
jgi:hypothetical protein